MIKDATVPGRPSSLPQVRPAEATDPQKKQVLNRPVFLHVKLPVPESGEV